MKRRPLARHLGLTGLWLSLVVLVGLWVAVGLTLVPARLALQEAGTQLTQLDRQLREVEQALLPLDTLGRSQSLAAARSLGQLARTAQDTPVVMALVGQDTLNDALTLTDQWTRMLAQAPSGRLAGARARVQSWQRHVHAAQHRLTWNTLIVGLVGTLLVVWFAAGQWALYRYAAGESDGRRGG
ncbi:hypothetical protein [Deinococcus navajonensis]|uniref:Uncharacterized protein n=1 Tax=Deinococcus navajonensis TaxID=309884 RepID=A0ABV8XPL1_9DEIO